MRRVQVLSGITAAQKKLAAKVAASLGPRFEIVSDKPDLIIVVGGDGTLLHYLRQLDYPAVPFLGVDAGSLGFFQELHPNDLAGLAAQLGAAKYHIQKLPLLKLVSGGLPSVYAFNEFAIERASARAAHLALTLDGHKFEKFIGDGLIISTPQGSTAYANAAGGAVLPYDLRAFQVVPSNPHQSALYKALRQPLVLGPEAQLDIEILSPAERPVRLVADGHSVEVGSSLSLSLSGKSVQMLRTAGFNFFERLSQKLIG